MAKSSGSAGRASSSSPSFASFRSGEPASIAVFRGSTPGGVPADFGDLGIGRYYSTSRSIASQYGKEVSRTTITLSSPRVLTAEQATRIVTRFGTTTSPSLARSTRLTAYFRRQGYDGLIIQGGYDSPPGFLTIVEFPR